MNPMSLLVLPREVLQQMRGGSDPVALAAHVCARVDRRGLIARELHEFGREFWARMMSPPRPQGHRVR